MQPYSFHPRRLPDAATFTRDAFLVGHTANELASRLELLAIEPQQVADIGAHNGVLTRQLAERYSSAIITALEPWQQLMPRRIKPRRPWQRNKVDIVDSPLSDIPLADDSVQLAVANLSLARFAEPDAVLAEAARIVAPGGAFMLATPGPDTLRELRDAWAVVDPEGAHVATFTDMHDVGDALVRHGFAEPVLDVERLTLTYASPDALWRDLSACCARNVLPDRRRGLTGRRMFTHLCHQLGNGGNGFQISVEIVYAQSWGQAPRPDRVSNGDIRISPTKIGRRV